MNRDLVHYLKGIRHLDVISLEEKLYSPGTVKIFPANVFYDLSQCLFAELGALAKLLLVIEFDLKNNANVFIALPTTSFTANEESAIESMDLEKKALLEAILGRRRNVNAFLKRAGFVNAALKIGEIYHSNVHMTEGFDFESKQLNFSAFEEAFSVVYEGRDGNEHGYKFLLPFKWIDCKNGSSEIANFEAELERVLTNEERGLDAIDVKSIKNVVLSELIKNVFEHSNSRFAIFSIGLINTGNLKRKFKHAKTNKLEKPYLDWVIKHEIPSQVEIYFGDSGNGILTKQYEDYIKSTTGHSENTKEALLLTAFQKWTTLKTDELRRGTKGLYRLHRIVKKYNGLVHIDTLGYDAGYFKNISLSRRAKYKFQGTLINIKLNPYKEIAAFRYTTEQSTALSQKWVSDKFEMGPSFKYEMSVKPFVQRNPNVLMLLDITAKDLAVEKERKDLEDLFYEISRDAEPTKVVLYLINQQSKIDNDTIDILIDSVQNRITETHAGSLFPEIENPDAEEILDPVLVLGDANKAFWYGGSRDLISVLDSSYLQETAPDIRNLMVFRQLEPDRQKQIFLYLSSGNTLVHVDSNFRLLFNFYGVEKHYEQVIEKAFRNEKDENVCTPKLHLVEKWVKISEVVAKDEYGFALCLYLKFRDFMQVGQPVRFAFNKNNIFILIDSAQQYGLAKKFVDLIGIRTKNIRDIDSDIDFNVPKRTKLFPKGSAVILLTTVISSSETIRRLVKYAKRDFAEPLAVLCLANFRKYNIAHLETWSDTTAILSCFQRYRDDSARIERDDNYFRDKQKKIAKASKIVNPDMGFEGDTKLQQVISINPELLKLLAERKLLHYNHYGVYNKRHFTFFLNKPALVNIQSFIWAKIVDSIDLWVKEIRSENFVIYLNTTLLGGTKEFATFLNSKYENQIRIFDKRTSRINESNVIYIDFGILTGDSVNDFISRCYGLDQLFICLLFNQSINSNADFFQKIDRLKFVDELNSGYILTKFRIEYLFHLPLNFFTSENCPICEHRRALDFFKLDHDYLFKFSEDRQERLKQNSADELLDIGYPVDFYYSANSKQQELSIQTIMQMYELKILLENAKSLTRYRIEVYNLLFELYEQLDEQVRNSDSRAYALLYYLSHEINWFQQEPLIFRDLRIIVSKIALCVAKCDTKKLIDYFKVSNHYDISNNSLAIRYKYSAISVLRSTDKLVFCQEIYNIIASFTNEQRSSDNLLQNCLYHISSLFKNSYNKSELYYLEIARNLRRVNAELNLSEEQHSAIENILKENKRIRATTIVVHAEPGAFRIMKTKWEYLYKVEMPKHPLPYEEFKALAITQHQDSFESYAENTLTEVEATVLTDITRSLKSHWASAKNYIDNNIIYYLNEQLHLLTSGSYFADKFSNSLNVATYRRNAEELNQLMDEINISLDRYIGKEDRYEYLYNYFLENYIQTTRLSNFSIDAKIFDLLADFPCNLNEHIAKVFPKETFPKRKISLNYNANEIIGSEGENIAVYFPKSLFNWHLERIVQNIKEKKNICVLLEQIEIQFEISISEAHMVNLAISYDCTEEYTSNENASGSLNSLKKLAKEFGGNFTYDLPDNDSNRFTINLKLMRYE